MSDLKEKPANITFLIIFVLFLIFNLYLFNPYFHTLAFAAIISGTFYPGFIWLQEKFQWKRQWTSLVASIVVLLVILIPLAYIIIQVSREVVGVYGRMKLVLSEESIQSFFFGDGFFASLFKQGLEIFNIDLTKEEAIQLALEKMQVYSGMVIKQLNTWVGDTFLMIFHFFIMVFAVYGLFLYGTDFKNYMFKLSPLPDDQEEKLLTKFNQMNYVTMVGNGVGGVIQGGLAGLAMWTLGIPSVFLWTTVMVVLAFIPLVGISFVTFPTAIYLIITQRISEGIFLLVFSIVVSFIVENWFKPKFIGQRVQVNGLLVFFYILAGMSTFGMAGIFYGPLMCIIFITLAELFSDSYMAKFSKV